MADTPTTIMLPGGIEAIPHSVKCHIAGCRRRMIVGKEHVGSGEIGRGQRIARRREPVRPFPPVDGAEDSAERLLRHGRPARPRILEKKLAGRLPLSDRPFVF